DQNAMDPPPVVRFRSPENEQKIAALVHCIEELSQKRTDRGNEPEAQREFQAWLDDIASHAQIAGDFDATKGLIAHWALDEPAGDVVASQHGKLGPGKVIGKTQRVAGKLNKAFQFRGNNYISL